MWELEFDTQRRVQSLTNPSLVLIKARIDALNNDSETLVNLQYEGGEISITGGNNGMVMVSCYPSLNLEKAFVLINPQVSLTGQGIDMCVQGQCVNYPARYFVSKELAFSATFDFFTGQKLSENLVWVNENEIVINTKIG